MQNKTKQQKNFKQEDFNYHMNETGDYRDTWKIFRIISEFVEGYEFLSKQENEITILGSARTKQEDIYYKIANELGSLIAKAGYTTITGGGPGIMEAANKGAYEAGGTSIGLNIQLPFEQRVNPFVNKSVAFYYFFTRKVMLTAPADAFVFFPGGFGTMDEFFEVVDHIELKKMIASPVILIGRDYWNPLLDFLHEKVCYTSPYLARHIEKWHLVDTAEEAFKIIQKEKIDGTEKMCELSPLSFHGEAKKMDWKIFRIMAEIVEGFEFLTGVIEDVTILGTKNISRDNKYYESGYQLGRMLGERGYTIITGGATGVAEAVNKGAIEVGANSLGIGMEVNGKARINQYVTKSIIFKFPFTRKLIVTSPSKAFVFYPGGFGTLHQLFEVLTLIQTEKMQKVPVILYDSIFWNALDGFIKEVISKKFNNISPQDENIYRIVDKEEEIVSIIEDFRK
jgi:uncharacterized protein (TIGR00730 family)